MTDEDPIAMSPHSDDPVTALHRRHWKARLIVAAIMLILAFIGIILMGVHRRAYWFFSQMMAVIYGVSCIWLHWYINRSEHVSNSTSIWHQILHWIGLLIMVYLTSIFVSTGIFTSPQAGLVTLTLLALSVFIAGVYTDPTLILVGITLTIFAAGSALIQDHLSLWMIPVLLVASLCIFLIVHHQRRRAEKVFKGK